MASALAVGLLAAGCSSTPSASSAANSLISQGLYAESAGKTHQAVDDFRSAAAQDPKDAVPYYELGMLDQQVLHNSAQAATAYKRALSLEPRYRAAMLNLANIDTPNNPQAALNLYNELILQNPKDASANFSLGLLLIAQNQPVPGHVALKKAIALDPALARRVPAGITP